MDMEIGCYRDLKDLSFDREAWRVAANKSRLKNKKKKNQKPQYIRNT